jgi:pimeloyl-ACP methyl ester carboxylesterase
MVLRARTDTSEPCTTRVFVYNETDSLAQISLMDHYRNFPPSVSWVSEKLLYLRVWWGRVLGTDLIYDVEREEFVYEESFRDGKILFEQHKESTEMTISGGPRTGFAEVNGARLFYEVMGEGHPLLLLHAGVGDSRMWDAQFEVFAREYRVVRLDMRGFGKSELAPGSFSYHEDAAALLDFLGIERAYVVGLSFGGRVAIDFALSHPEMVAALVLGAPGVSGHEFSAEVLRFEAEEEALLERGDLDGAVELNLRMWVDGPHRAPGEVGPSVRELVREMQLDSFCKHVPQGVELRPLVPPAVARLEEVRAPTLLVVGELDVPEFVRLADTAQTRVTGAKKVVIRGAAHLPHLEKPEEFNRIVMEFLGEQ